MYIDRRGHTRFWLLCAAALLVLALIVTALVSRKPAEGVQEETAYAIRRTIEHSALQCFTVEGVYPESMDYLVEHYGLRVNTADYYVVYEVFADNLPPNIRVAKKEG